jgi:hypothetical protein
MRVGYFTKNKAKRVCDVMHLQNEAKRKKKGATRANTLEKRGLCGAILSLSSSNPRRRGWQHWCGHVTIDAPCKPEADVCDLGVGSSGRERQR